LRCASVTSAAAPTQALNFYVGSINTNYAYTMGWAGTIYGVQISKNGVLVRDLRPAAWTDYGVTVYGFYDMVSGGLHMNSGSGTLTGVLNGAPANSPFSSRNLSPSLSNSKRLSQEPFI